MNGRPASNARCVVPPCCLLAAEEAMSSADGIEDHSSTLVNIGACMADLEHIGATAEQVKKGEIRLVVFLLI